MTDDGWSLWAPHDGGECPIPWARAGEYQAELRDGDTIGGWCGAALFSQGTSDWWRHEGLPAANIIAYRYLLSAAPPGWTPPGSTTYTAPRDDLAKMQPQPIAPEEPAFAENTEAGLRIFKLGDRPHVAERHDGYDLLLDMETRAVVGVQWPIQAKAIDWLEALDRPMHDMLHLVVDVVGMLSPKFPEPSERIRVSAEEIYSRWDAGRKLLQTIEKEQTDG